MNDLPRRPLTLTEAMAQGDLPALQAWVQQGGDMNAPCGCGPESLLSDALETICDYGGGLYRREHPPGVLQCIRWACENGAALHHEPPSRERLDDEGPAAVMWSAFYTFDTEVIATLLMGGYDPNWATQFCLAHGIEPEQAVLNNAAVQYAEKLYGINEHPPEPLFRAAFQEDTSSEWIEVHDWIARKQGLRRPDHLFLLHHFGARSAEEYQRLIAEQPDWAPEPPAVCMAKALADCLVRQDLPAARSLLRAGADLNFVFHAPEHSAHPLTPVSLALLQMAKKDDEQRRVTDPSGWLREVFAWGVQPNAAAMCDGGLGLFEAAVRHLNPQLMACLLELGCDPNAPRPPGGYSVFDVAIQVYRDSLWLGGGVKRKTLPRTTAAAVLHFVHQEEIGETIDMPHSLTLLIRYGALLGSELAAGVRPRRRFRVLKTIKRTELGEPSYLGMAEACAADRRQLVHFAFSMWEQEDGYEFGLIVMDDVREVIERSFARLMAEQPADSASRHDDGRFSNAALEAGWAVASQQRPQVHRWINQADIATSRGDTGPADRRMPKCIPAQHYLMGRGLGVIWTSDAGVAAVRRVLAEEPEGRACFIATGHYFHTGRPARVVEQLADELSLRSWTLHCSGLEGPITLLARVHEVFVVLPVDRPRPEAEVWDAIPSTMRWLLWTAHRLGLFYNIVAPDGDDVTWFRPTQPPEATVAAVKAADFARQTFTAQVKALDMAYVNGGSGLFCGDVAVPLDLLNVPFDVVQRISRWQEWGEAVFNRSDGVEVPDAVRIDFQAQAMKIAAALREALGGRVKINVVG